MRINLVTRSIRRRGHTSLLNIQGSDNDQPDLITAQVAAIFPVTDWPHQVAGLDTKKFNSPRRRRGAV